MRALACVLGAVGLVFAGCAGETSTPSPTAPSPAASPTAVPATPTSNPTSEGRVRIQLVGDQPVLRASALDGDHYQYILPAVYFVAGDVRHAYVVGFGEARGDQHVYHATSVDGLDWAIDPVDPFAGLGLDFSAPGPIPTSVLEIDGAWVMYLWGVPAPKFDESAIWRATAAAPGGPWTADGEPALSPGATGAWDDRALDFPAVLPSSDGYLMLYSASGGPQPDAPRIGRATSEDGVHWLRGSEPVAELGLCPFDVRYVAQPRIASSGNEVLVLYDTERRVGAAAVGQGGGDWRCLSDVPLLSGDDIPGGQGIHTLAAAQTASGISVLMESLVEGGSELWLGEVGGLD